MGDKISVFKAADEEQRIVFSEVYAPMIPDSDQEYMDAQTIRDMAYKFMREMKLDQIDQQHDNVLVQEARVVESFIARKGDPTFVEGAWVVGIHIPDDETWDKVKKGELNGFSMQAMVHKTPVEVTIEVPPIVEGLTIKSEGHEHKFSVAYDETGRFLGGKTDTVDGHFHIIKRGTVTEVAADHTHRFSHVDGLQIIEPAGA